jgi:hypothetical protein
MVNLEGDLSKKGDVREVIGFRTRPKPMSRGSALVGFDLPGMTEPILDC